MHPVFQNGGENSLSFFPSSVPLPPFSLCTPSPLKKSDYSVNPIKLKLKSTNILVKFSQKNILFINFLCLEIFQTLVYFCCLEMFQTSLFFRGTLCYGHWNYVLINSRREDHNKILMFHILFF